MNPLTKEQRQVLLEELYHECLKHLNIINNHPVMSAMPNIRQEITLTADNLIKLRDLTREAL